MELLICSALGQQNDQPQHNQQNNQQPNNGDCEPNRTNENRQIKHLDETASSHTNSILNNNSTPLSRDLNRKSTHRDVNREASREMQSREIDRELKKDINNLNKQATLAALVASMNQFSNTVNNQLAGNQHINNQLINSQLTNSQLNSNQQSGSQLSGHSNQISNQNQMSAGNHLSNSQLSNSQVTNSQLINNQLMNSQFSSNQQLHNSLTFDNVKNLLLSQRKTDRQQENIFSGGFQNLLTNLKLSINSNNDNYHNSSNNTLASPNWRPIRSNAQNMITSAKQTGPASWIDRSKLGKVAAQSMYFLANFFVDSIFKD